MIILCTPLFFNTFISFVKSLSISVLYSLDDFTSSPTLSYCTLDFNIPLYVDSGILHILNICIFLFPTSILVDIHLPNLSLVLYSFIIIPANFLVKIPSVPPGKYPFSVFICFLLSDTIISVFLLIS